MHGHRETGRYLVPIGSMTKTSVYKQNQKHKAKTQKPHQNFGDITIAD